MSSEATSQMSIHAVADMSISPRTMSMMRKAASEIFSIPSNEFPRLVYHGVILSCIIAGFWLLDSLKDPILTNAVGIEYQPMAKVGSVITTLLVVCLYDFITSMVEKITLFHIVAWIYGIAIMILSALLADPMQLDPSRKGPNNYIGWICYFTIESYGSLMAALFWSFTNSVVDLEEAKGGYGLIIAIAQFGAILGSTMATRATTYGISQLFLMGAMSILVVSILVKLYVILFRTKAPHVVNILRSRVRNVSEDTFDGNLRRLSHSNSGLNLTILPNASPSPSLSWRQPAEDAVVTNPLNIELLLLPWYQSGWLCWRRCYLSIARFFAGFYGGLMLILRYNYTLKLFGISCLYEVVVTVLDYQFKILGAADSIASGQALADSSIVDENRFATLLGHFGQVTNFLSFFISIVGFPLLVRKVGVKGSLLIFPLFLIVAVVMINLYPNLWVLFVFVSLVKAMIFSLNDPVKELLYSPTSDAVKFKAKAWIDVFGSRLAKGAGSFITNVSEGDVVKLRSIAEIPCLAISLCLLLLAWSIGGDFAQLLANREVIGDDLQTTLNSHTGSNITGPKHTELLPEKERDGTSSDQEWAAFSQ